MYLSTACNTIRIKCTINHRSKLREKFTVLEFLIANAVQIEKCMEHKLSKIEAKKTDFTCKRKIS